MKNLILLFAVAAMFTACASNVSENVATTVDSVSATSTEVVDTTVTTVVDTTVAPDTVTVK